MLRIAVCDDDSNTVAKYSKLINDLSKKNHIEVELSYFYSGESLTDYFIESPDVLDIVYLDIVMEDMNGIDTARKLQESGSHTLIIFLTGYEKYVFEAFDVNAVNYLIKDDFCPERFEKVFLTAANLVSSKEKQLFSYAFDGKTKVVSLEEIAYFETWNKRVTIHYSDKKTDIYYESMERLEMRLKGKGFVRSHRSFLVHLPYIVMVQKNALSLKTGETLPVGGTYSSSVKKSLSEYISRHNIYSLENPEEGK